jgi:hypothetical protein
MICTYCQKHIAPDKKSGEHVISKSVLKIGLGDKISNITSSSIFDNKTLFDYQHKIYDVCVTCNNRISPYDNAGKAFASEVNKYFDASNVLLHIDTMKLGWLIKTHLNFIRSFPDKTTGAYYPINGHFYDALIKQLSIDSALYCLLIEGMKGKRYYWDENDPRRIQFFRYKHVIFPRQRIVVSDLRLKAIKTYLLLPSDDNYDNFSIRSKSTRVDMKIEQNKNPDEVDVDMSQNLGYINVKCQNSPDDWY